VRYIYLLEACCGSVVNFWRKCGRYTCGFGLVKDIEIYGSSAGEDIQDWEGNRKLINMVEELCWYKHYSYLLKNPYIFDIIFPGRTATNNGWGDRHHATLLIICGLRPFF